MLFRSIFNNTVPDSEYAMRLESGRVDLTPGSKIGCDGHRKNPLLAENRRYAAMNFGHKVRDELEGVVLRVNG